MRHPGGKDASGPLQTHSTYSSSSSSSLSSLDKCAETCDNPEPPAHKRSDEHFPQELKEPSASREGGLDLGKTGLPLGGMGTHSFWWWPFSPRPSLEAPKLKILTEEERSTRNKQSCFQKTALKRKYKKAVSPMRQL